MPDEEVEFSQPKAPRPAKDLQILTGDEASGRVSPETSEKNRAVSNRCAPNWEEPTEVTPLDNLSLYNEAARHYAWKSWAKKEQKKPNKKERR